MQADDALKALKSIDENLHSDVERQVDDHLKKLSQIKCGFRKLHTNENYHIVSLCIQGDCQQPLGGKPGVCRDMCLRCLTQKHRSHTSISFEELAEFAIANKMLRDRALAKLKEEKLKQINEYQAHHNKLCEEAKQQLEQTFASLASDKGVEALYQNYRNTIDIFNANPIPESSDDPEWQAAQNKCRQAVLDLAQFTSQVMHFEKKDGEDGKYTLSNHQEPEKLDQIIELNEKIKKWYNTLFEEEKQMLEKYLTQLKTIESNFKDKFAGGYKPDLDFHQTEIQISKIESDLQSGNSVGNLGQVSRNLDDIKKKKLEQTLKLMQLKGDQIKGKFSDYCAEIKQRELTQEEKQTLGQLEKAFLDQKTYQEKKIQDLMKKCDELNDQAKKQAQAASKQQQAN